MKVLYSFRRCPYAMRARLALWAAGINCELREIVLRDKPAAMLELSAKGTVPVLQLDSGQVLDESADILRWALEQSDPLGWWSACDSSTFDLLVANNDGPFKHHLDRYKYAARFDGADPEREWQLAREALSPLRSRLEQHAYLCGESLSAADVALFPFVRQFRNVEPQRFADTEPVIEAWLAPLLNSRPFVSIMRKLDVWKLGDAPVYFSDVYGPS